MQHFEERVRVKELKKVKILRLMVGIYSSFLCYEKEMNSIHDDEIGNCNYSRIC
jgi:hypothetical protein